MFRICKIVVPNGSHSVEFYMTRNGFWSPEVKDAKHFLSEKEVDELVDQFNNSADKHWCRQFNTTYKITTYLKEEI